MRTAETCPYREYPRAGDEVAICRLLGAITGLAEADTPPVARRFRGAGVGYLRVEHRNVYQTRRAGLEATRSEVLCFLDADDILPPDYLEKGLPLFYDPEVGIVYSDVAYFGDWTGGF